MVFSALADRDLSALPLSLLQAELQRRQDDGDAAYQKPACGSGRPTGGYNTASHVFALVLIFALSTLACGFPILARRFPDLPFPHRFLFLSRHFGTGVLIATAFVHLLPTAFSSLTDPCLPSFWNEGYPAMPGLIAMLSVFLVVSIEMFFATRGAGHSHASEFDGSSMPTAHTSHHRTRTGSFRRFQQADIRDDGDNELPMHELRGPIKNGSTRSNKPSPSPNNLNINIHDPDDDELSFTELEAPDENDESAPLTDTHSPVSVNLRPRHNRHASMDPSANFDPTNPKKQLLQCLLLEAGILFHSVFIGMAVSVSTGSAFVVFLIAICFHQTFEGLALGSRIGTLIPALFPATSPKPWLMVLAYGTTTPIGQAIGLILHNMYDPESATGLLMVGVTNSMSSGLLLFAGLVELLAEDFLSDRSYETLKGRRRIEACMAVAAGGLLMALVGAWA